jgi:hypothetical protein
MEVIYRITWRERLKGYRIGWSQMTLLYRAVWIVLLLLFFVSQLLRRWLQGYPVAWPLAKLPPFPPPSDIAGHVAATGFGLMIGAVLIACFSPLRTVQIAPSFLVCKTWGLSNRVRWESLTTILDTGDYICFCRAFPVAVVIPKSAFRREERVNAFLEQATHYWHDATGRTQPLPLDTAGVWPPAPRPGNSVEPGDGPEC